MKILLGIIVSYLLLVSHKCELLRDLSFSVTVCENDHCFAGGVVLSEYLCLTPCSDLLSYPVAASKLSVFSPAEEKFVKAVEIVPHSNCTNESSFLHDFVLIRVDRPFKLEQDLRWYFPNENLPGKFVCQLNVFNKSTSNFVQRDVVIGNGEVCINQICPRTERICIEKLSSLKNKLYCATDYFDCMNFPPAVFCGGAFLGFAKWNCEHGPRSTIAVVTREALSVFPERFRRRVKRQAASPHAVIGENRVLDVDPSYIVGIVTKYDDEFITTGIIVSRLFIVTSCVHFVEFSGPRVSKLMDPKTIAFKVHAKYESLDVRDIQVHKDCTRVGYDVLYDVGSLLADEFIDVTFYKPVSLPNSTISSLEKKIDKIAVARMTCSVKYYDFSQNLFRQAEGTIAAGEKCKKRICEKRSGGCMAQLRGIDNHTICMFTGRCISIDPSPLICDDKVWGISKTTDCEIDDRFPILFEKILVLPNVTTIVFSENSIRDTYFPQRSKGTRKFNTFYLNSIAYVLIIIQIKLLL